MRFERNDASSLGVERLMLEQFFEPSVPKIWFITRVATLIAYIAGFQLEITENPMMDQRTEPKWNNYSALIAKLET